MRHSAKALRAQRDHQRELEWGKIRAAQMDARRGERQAVYADCLTAVDRVITQPLRLRSGEDADMLALFSEVVRHGQRLRLLAPDYVWQAARELQTIAR